MKLLIVRDQIQALRVGKTALVEGIFEWSRHVVGIGQKLFLALLVIRQAVERDLASLCGCFEVRGGFSPVAQCHRPPMQALQHDLS